MGEILAIDVYGRFPIIKSCDNIKASVLEAERHPPQPLNKSIVSHFLFSVFGLRSYVRSAVATYSASFTGTALPNHLIKDRFLFPWKTKSLGKSGHSCVPQ
jgi:hypothetical protein